MHYQRWRTHGDPLRTRSTAAERFWAKVDKTGTCWLWTGSTTVRGYGQFGAGGKSGKNYRAHVWAWEQVNGPVPDGLVLDHTCHSADPDCPGGSACAHRQCVNPAHMEAVTVLENVLRGRQGDVVQGRRDTCSRGHPLTGNVYVDPRGHTACRTCRNENAATYRQRKKMKDMNPEQPTFVYPGAPATK